MKEVRERWIEKLSSTNFEIEFEYTDLFEPKTLEKRREEKKREENPILLFWFFESGKIIYWIECVQENEDFWGIRGANVARDVSRDTSRA